MLYALDLGNKQVKLKSAKIERVLPSYFVESELYGNRSFFNDITDDKDTKDFESVHDSGVKYVWGTDLDLTTDVTDSAGFGLSRYKSREFKLLVDFALAELATHDAVGEETVTVDVVTGVPSDDYANLKILEQVASVIKGKHLVTVDGKTISIVVENLLIVPQPLGTLYDIVCDDSGEIVEEAFKTANIGLVDVGGGTVLMDSFRSMNMELNKRDQTTNGSYALFRDIIRELNKDNIQISEYELEEAIRKHDGMWSPDNMQKIDLKPVIEAESKKYTRRLISRVKSAYKGLGRLQKVIYTGGTANLLDKEELEDYYGNLLYVVEDAEMANVRGFYKYYLNKVTSKAKQEV